MIFYEKEMRGMFGHSSMLKNPVFAGRTMLAKLDGTLRVKLSFTTTGIRHHYDSIVLSVINRKEGCVDTQTFKFSDIIGKKKIENRDEIEPYIWEYNGKADWYVLVSAVQKEQIAGTILEYIGMYRGEE